MKENYCLAEVGKGIVTISKSENIQIGNLVYSMSQKNELIPLGVIVIIEDLFVEIMAFHAFKSNWGCLFDYKETFELASSISDMDICKDICNGYDFVNALSLTSEEATNVLIKAGDIEKYPAAHIARKYFPPEATETKGLWNLPSHKVCRSMHENQFVIFNAFDPDRVNFTELPVTHYANATVSIWKDYKTWSSTVLFAPCCKQGIVTVKHGPGRFSNTTIKSTIGFNIKAYCGPRNYGYYLELSDGYVRPTMRIMLLK